MKTNTEWNVARRVVDATEVNSVITWLDNVPMAVTPECLEKNVLTVIIESMSILHLCLSKIKHGNSILLLWNMTNEYRN